MKGLGIDFGSPEGQHSQTQFKQDRVVHPAPTNRSRTISMPAAYKSRPNTNGQLLRPQPGHHHPRSQRPNSASRRLPSPQRRVRIASGQPGILGHGAGHTSDEDVFSSSGTTTSLKFQSSKSKSAIDLRRILDSPVTAHMRSSVINASSSASESGSNYDSLLRFSDFSASSPSDTETSATTYSSLAPARGLSIRKQSSQPNLSLRNLEPCPARTYGAGPPASAAGLGLPRSQSSTSLRASVSGAESGTTLGRAFEIRPSRQQAFLRSGRPVSRGRGGSAAGARVGSHGQTKSWDGGPIPVLQGQGLRTESDMQLKLQQPYTMGMVPDGFGGYMFSELAESTTSNVSCNVKQTSGWPSPIEESSPELPRGTHSAELRDGQQSYETTAPLNIRDRMSRHDGKTASEASAASTSSYTSGGHPQRALRVGAFYDAEGREAARLVDGECLFQPDLKARDQSQQLVNAQQKQGAGGNDSSASQPHSRAKSVPAASLMRAPSLGRPVTSVENTFNDGGAHRRSLTSEGATVQSAQTGPAAMRSVRGFQGLQGAEDGGAMVLLSQYGTEFETGEQIVPKCMSQADQDSILDSVRVEIQSDRACRQAATTRSTLTEELSGNALPNGKMLSHSRSAVKLGLTRSTSEDLTLNSAANANLERHGTLINPSANSARRSRDLQRLLGDSKRKALSSTASDTETGSRSRSPLKAGSGHLRRSNAVGGNVAPPAILEQGRRKEARVDIDVMLESDLVVEGGMLRGRLEVKIRKPSEGEGAVYLAQPKVRVVGFEELIGGEDSRHIFFHHACLVHGDSRHPGGSQPFVLHGSPTLSSPETEGCSPLLCFSSGPDHEGYYAGREGVHSILFNLEVPIGKGAKGSYRGKHAHVRYIVIGSIKLKDAQGGNRSIAHFYRHVELFPYLNPAIVLSSAPKALQAAAEKGLFLGGSGKVRVVASLHRGTWVAGQRVYVKVNVQNATSKRINSVSLTLIRTVTLFRPKPEFNMHASAGADVDPDACTTSTTRKKVTEEILEMGQKGARGFVTAKGWWTGVEANSNLEFSHHLAIPSDALTIPRARHVEVAYHVRVAVGSSLSSDVTVELPLRIINFISLDPPPLKVVGHVVAPRTWTTTSTTARGSVSSEEGVMIALVKSADALRSPGRVEIGRREPNLPSQGPSHVLALSQRATLRNGGVGAALQTPQDPARLLQHQKSLDFINHAIQSATARRNSNQNLTDGSMPMGLGIDVPDGAESSSDGIFETDTDATPTRSSISSFSSSGSDRASTYSSSRPRSHQSAVHPSCMPYEHIDVPAPSFGFPFVQLPAVSVDDTGDDSDGEEQGNRTLGLNDDSVAEVDLVVSSTRLDSNAFERMLQHGRDESIDSDISVETIRGDDGFDDGAGLEIHRREPTDGEPGEELTHTDRGGSRPPVIVQDVETNRSALHIDTREATREPSHPRQTSTGPRATLSAGAQALASSPPRVLTSGTERSSGNMCKQSSVSSLRSSAAKGNASTGPRLLPASKDAPAPSKPALKAKSSFTFATSDAPIRIAKAGASRLCLDAVKPAHKAKVAPENMPPKSAAVVPENALRKSRPLLSEPRVVAVPAPKESQAAKSGRGSPAKSDYTTSGDEAFLSESSPGSAHEALTPESVQAELRNGVDRERTQYVCIADSDPFSQELRADKNDLGLLEDEPLNSDYKLTEPPMKKFAKTAHMLMAPRVRREDSAELPSTATAPRILRHSNSTASLTGERLQRSHSNAAGTASRNAAVKTTNIRGTNVTISSVRNKIAMLESRQQALKDFTRSASGSRAGYNGVGSSNSPVATHPRRKTRFLTTPADEPRSLAHETSRNSLVPRDLARRTSKASLAASEASTTVTSSSSAAPEWMRRGSIASNTSFKAPMLRRA